MYNIENNLVNGRKIFVFHGPINSINAEEIGNYVFSNVTTDDDAIFDFNDVEYLSSAGLRIVLKAAKATKSFEVRNVKPDVYEVFDMTGFTQIVKISKAMREVSIEGKEMIGEGYMGRVYRLDPETIIKVYYRDSTIDDIYREISLAKKAFVLGIPTAIPFDVVRVKEGNYGSIFELLSSSCFNKLFIQHPEKTDEYIDLYIKLLKEMMAIEIPNNVDLPKKIDEAYLWLETLQKEQTFEPHVFEKMKKLIDEIPHENHLIHGDYHIKNIMMQGDEPLLIDMDTLGVGHEIFEFCAFFLTYIGYPSTEENNSKEFLGVDQEVSDRIFYRTVNEVFADRSEEERQGIIDKCALIGYFWLAYKTLVFEPSNTKRYEHSREEVIRLIDKVDSLAF